MIRKSFSKLSPAQADSAVRQAAQAAPLLALSITQLHKTQEAGKKILNYFWYMPEKIRVHSDSAAAFMSDMHPFDYWRGKDTWGWNNPHP